jgi:hypothetical protein
MSAYPSAPVPVQVTLRSTQPTRTSLSHALKRQARTRGAQRWAMRLSYAPLLRSSLAPLFAFLLSMRGQADTFTLVLPTFKTPQGTWGGAPVVNGVGQTGSTVSLLGLTASQAAAAKAGDLLKFAGHTKVYMVTADAASDGTGLATVSIQPPLIYTISDGEVITTSNVPFTVAMASDNLDTSLSPGVNFSFDVDFVEVF